MPIPPAEFACRKVLVIGGARSGKSRHAQALADGSGLAKLFLATAEGLDDEMRERISRHRADRDEAWRTREEPLELSLALREEAAPGKIVLVDCLTLWLSNLMHAGRKIDREIADLKAAVAALQGPAILVTNEVGLGLAPMTPLGRAFRDWQGRLNAEIADAADVVVAMTAGLPTIVKPAPRPGLVFR
jgi:adenosylcobinamide kinase/adenosylcobinamide-phosphate guanylyltransferase